MPSPDVTARVDSLVQSAASSAVLPSGVRRGYALGGIASGTFGTVPKAWDFFLNPVAGRVSDRSTNPRGHRRPIMVRAGLAMAACFALIFAGPTTGAGLATAWVVLVYLVGATAYAFFQVPYLAMSAEITSDYSERTRLMTWRVIVITLAILVSGGSAPLLVDALDGAAGYRLMGLVMATLIMLGGLGVWWGTRDAVLTRTQTGQATLREQVQIALTNPHAPRRWGLAPRRCGQSSPRSA